MRHLVAFAAGVIVGALAMLLAPEIVELAWWRPRVSII
jgi:hypothetical protein